MSKVSNYALFPPSLSSNLFSALKPARSFGNVDLIMSLPKLKHFNDSSFYLKSSPKFLSVATGPLCSGLCLYLSCGSPPLPKFALISTCHLLTFIKPGSFLSPATAYSIPFTPTALPPSWPT